MTCRIAFASIFATILWWSSCTVSIIDELGDNELERITTVTLTFKAPDGSTQDFSIRDLDGVGGEQPIADDVSLSANTTYELFVKFLDETDPSAPVDRTDEVREEDSEHLVCYLTTSAIPTPQPTDYDLNGEVLGLEAAMTTGDPAIGFLTVRLRHLPDKASAAPCATGRTDVEVSFLVEVK